MIITRTPFRISFFGGGTDYPTWYREEPGAVLSTTIDKYCWINLRDLPSFFEYKSRIVYTKTELVSSIGEIKHPSIREALRYMKYADDSRIELHHAGDLPARTGLGASSTFIVGLLHALYVKLGISPSKYDLAKGAIEIEQNHVGDAVGSQDQTAAAFGGLNEIQFHGENDIRVMSVDVPPERIAALESHLMLYFTGIFRSAPEIAADQISHFKDHKAGLREMRGMVAEGIQILKGNGNLDAFGKLLHEGWRLKKELSDKVSNPTIDGIYQAAREAGAIGGKLLGAGGGGFMLFFVRPEEHHKVRERLKELVKVPFRFDDAGSQVIFRRLHS